MSLWAELHLTEALDVQDTVTNHALLPSLNGGPKVNPIHVRYQPVSKNSTSLESQAQRLSRQPTPEQYAEAVSSAVITTA
jgi:hypothetical protein